MHSKRLNTILETLPWAGILGEKVLIGSLQDKLNFELTFSFERRQLIYAFQEAKRNDENIPLGSLFKKKNLSSRKIYFFLIL